MCKFSRHFDKRISKCVGAVTAPIFDPVYSIRMNIFILLTTFALGMSEAIEMRLPQDPDEVYTVGFDHNGVDVRLDWQNREIVAQGTCRETTSEDKAVCQQAAIAWLRAECAWYSAKETLSVKQEDMQYAVCLGADALNDLLSTHQLADR